ncbi:oligopeptide transport system substrate-binding protein [Rhodococcus maanshanensis]|uniref:Oligopeptide transport system substrate-binding protein n=1 Tax=Rhodococcus maanshanensis TaxID=183556 RepID=A0A1H7HLU5_9NOCA|nr:ABC transporter substrate-binding protein [Rhodococcus maanshanensis]SEK51353.1 oligopeptide transport system substrate-binding protein [Rhodococcus maanshanensis]
MKFHRLTALTALALSGVLVLSACSSTSDGGSDMVTANGSEPQNPLIPTNTNENGGGRIVDRLFAGLESYDARGNIQHEVAQSIETTDSKSFVIKIEPDWTFTDGTPVTAKSFVDAWNYGALSTNAQLQSSFFEPIVGYDEVAAGPPTAQTMSGLKIVDDTTFTVDLKQPTADFRLRLGFTPFYPLPEVAFLDMAAFGERPVGNGPYEFAAGDAWQHNVRLDLVPNPDYRGNRTPNNGGMSFVFYSSLDTAYADLQAGNLDVLDTVPESAMSTFRADLGDRALEAPTAQNGQIGIPGNLPHFAGPEGGLRRQALSRAIDRGQITQQIFQGLRTPARDFTASSLPGFNANLPGVLALEYDAEAAKALWAQADSLSPWSGRFEIAYNSDGGHQAWVDAAANSIRNTLGIDAVGAPYPTFKQIRTEITNRTIGSAFRSGWQGDYPSILEFLEPQFVTGAGSNDEDYSNPAFDDLVRRAEAATGQEESFALAGQAQEILLRDLPVLPLWDYIAAAGHSEAVSEVQISWNGLPMYEAIKKS